MAWSPEFKSEIERRQLHPRFLLETVQDTDFEPGVGTLALSSHITPGYSQGITLNGSRVSAGRMEVGDWSYSIPEMSIGYRGDIDIRRSVARGQLLVLRVGWPGWAEGDYEPVFYGHLQAVNRTGEEWSIVVRSILASLVSRMTQDSASTALFGGLGESTLASANYVAGVSSVLRVTSAATAEKEGGAGGAYLLQVTGDDSEPFFVIAGALDTSPVGYDEFQTLTPGILGTVDADATVGVQVKFCGFIHDSPTRATRRVLMSTGSGLNGIYDTLPFSWGVGIPQSIVDDDDCDRTKTITQPSGATSSKWYVYSAEEQDDGLSWLSDVLAPAGMVLCERHGMLTIRAVSPANQNQYATERITDADLISIDLQETWSSAVPVEYAFLRVKAASNTFGEVDDEDLDSRPASAEKVIDLFYTHEDDTAWEDSVINRVSPWFLRIAEVVEITCLGLRLATLAPCDSVELDVRHFRTRDGVTLPTLMVLSVEADWFGGTVRIVAAYHPPTASEF